MIDIMIGLVTYALPAMMLIVYFITRFKDGKR